MFNQRLSRDKYVQNLMSNSQTMKIFRRKPKMLAKTIGASGD